MENRPSPHPRIHAVETPVDHPEHDGQRPGLEIAFYPDRLDRDSTPVELTPSQAVRYTENAERAAAAAETAGSRQRLEVSMAALWSESGATAGPGGRGPAAPSRPVEPAAASDAEPEAVGDAHPPRPIAATPDHPATDADDPFASLEQAAAEPATPVAPGDLAGARAGARAASEEADAAAVADEVSAEDRSAPIPELSPADAGADADTGAEADAETGTAGTEAEQEPDAEERQPWWAAARSRGRTSWWRRLLGRG